VDKLIGQFQPLLVDDGLWLELVAVADGCVTVRLTGVSQRCAAIASVNFQTGLEELLRQQFDTFRELKLLLNDRWVAP
jgi:Fe-S cluster biogenesis protein NfuA